MDLQNLKYQKAYIQCTWANAFVNPVWNKGECIVSYDRNWIRKYFAIRKNNKVTIDGKILTFDSDCIGFLTGNSVQDEKGNTWVEIYLNYCNRRLTGFIRLNDIWFDGKYTDKNTDDVEIQLTKKSNKTLWAGLAVGLFSLIKN